MEEFYDRHVKCQVLDACKTVKDYLYKATYQECGLVNQDKGTLSQLLYILSRTIREGGVEVE